MDEDYHWRFVGFATDIEGKPTIRLYAHVTYGTGCRAVVAEEDRSDHRYWCEDVIRR